MSAAERQLLEALAEAWYERPPTGIRRQWEDASEVQRTAYISATDAILPIVVSLQADGYDRGVHEADRLGLDDARAANPYRQRDQQRVDALPALLDDVKDAADRTAAAVHRALVDMLGRVDAAIQSETARLGGQETVDQSPMLLNWVGGIRYAGRVLRMAMPDGPTT